MSIPIKVKSYKVSQNKPSVTKEEPVEALPTNIIQPVDDKLEEMHRNFNIREPSDSLPQVNSEALPQSNSRRSFNPEVISLDPQQILSRRKRIDERTIRQHVKLEDEEEIEEKRPRRRRRENGFNWKWLLGIALAGGIMMLNANIPAGNITPYQGESVDKFPAFSSDNS